MTIKPFALLCGLLLFASCSSDDNIEEKTEPITPPAATTNINANPSTIKEYSRLEMPRLHQGTDTILVHKTSNGTVNYITEWDYAKKSQRWSCYILDKDLARSEVNRYENKDNQYPNDPLIPTSMQWGKDPYYYNGQKLDHGHICPSADRLSSFELNYQTFFLTNMQPQFNAFNAGLWAKLEKKVRIIASTCDTLFICKGGTIDEGKYGGYNKVYRTLGNGLIMPRYFFMAMLRVTKGKYTALGIWTDQIDNANDDGSNLSQYAISIDELEKRTGIDFFCNLPDDIEDKVEKSFNSSLSWKL
ncbi:MAG: DNA/RNA non-specific endonuclease [Prevotella sp.]|jgi:endonuclease G